MRAGAVTFLWVAFTIFVERYCAIGGVIGIMDPKLYTKERNKVVKLSVSNLFHFYGGDFYCILLSKIY
ncbi:hypothetical protein MHYMCMPSP_00745 [Hyalomma marginatum]|nr:hypothetical protein MHYMCMPSP_00745 [Hyalomma marginatum]